MCHNHGCGAQCVLDLVHWIEFLLLCCWLFPELTWEVLVFHMSLVWHERAQSQSRTCLASCTEGILYHIQV